MVTHGHLEISVIYTADRSVSSRRERGVSRGRFDARRRLGSVILLVAAAWIYATWFPLRHTVGRAYFEALFALPGLVDLSRILTFKPVPPELALPNSSGPDTTDDTLLDWEDTPAISAFRSEGETGGVSPEQRADSAARRSRLDVTLYAWLATMTTVGCWLALTGAAGVGGWLSGPGQARPARLFALLMLLAAGIMTWMYWPQAGGETFPAIPPALQYGGAAAFGLAAWALAASASTGRAWALFAFALVLLGVGGGLVWRFYETGWPVRASQVFSFALMIVCALLGAALGPRFRRLTLVAVVLILLSSLVTGVGIWYAHRNGGFASISPTPRTYLLVVGIQSLFAWVLLGARRAIR